MPLRNSIWSELQLAFRRGNTVNRLIFVNIAVFLIINIGIVIARLFAINESAVAIWLKFFTLPADMHQLLYRPWTLVTHMFSHIGFFHILFNMLWLYWMGRILTEYLGNRKILPVFMMGAWAGAVLYIASYNIFPGLQSDLPLAEALGASAGVMAIIVATATLLPDYTIFLLFIGPVKLKWLAVAALLIDLISIQGMNSGGHIAHLGGALFGFVFIKELQAGNDWSKGFNRIVDALTDAFKPGPAKPTFTRTKESRKNRKSKKSAPKHLDAATQKKVDAILDKIADSGYDSLNKSEKEFLFKISKRDL